MRQDQASQAGVRTAHFGCSEEAGLPGVGLCRETAGDAAGSMWRRASNIRARNIVVDRVFQRLLQQYVHPTFS